MFSKSKLIVASVIAVALLTIGIGGSIALAQGPTTNPGQGGKPGLAQLYLQALASKLGITPDKLQQTMQDARTDALNQAVKNGLITQAQADKLKNQPINGSPFGQRPQVAQAVRVFSKNAIESTANALGMKPADVLNALRNGKTLADLAKDKGVSQDKVKQAIVDAEKAAIDQALKDGKITKDRADVLTSKLDPSKIDLNKKHLQPRKGNGKT